MHHWDSAEKMIKEILLDFEEKSNTSSFVSQTGVFLYLGVGPCEGTEQVLGCWNNNWCRKVGFLVWRRLVDKLGEKRW